MPNYKAMTAEELLSELRTRGWSVGVHNDYKQNNFPNTFWLLTHRNGRYVQGEGATDKKALLDCIEIVEGAHLDMTFRAFKPYQTAVKDAKTVEMKFASEEKLEMFMRWFAKQG